MKKEFSFNMFNEIGEDLCARTLGIDLRKKANLELMNVDVIIFDFKGVKSISTGFAYELFGYLYKDLREEFSHKIKLRLYDENREHVKNIIIKAIAT